MRHVLLAVVLLAAGCESEEGYTPPQDGGGGGDLGVDASAPAADAGPADAAPPDGSGHGQADAGPCSNGCERWIDCPQPGWDCEAVEVEGCAAPVRRCRSNCLRYRDLPTADDRCCLDGLRVDPVCTPERGFECPAGATTTTPSELGVFSATLFGCGELATAPEPEVPCGLVGAGLDLCPPEQRCCYSITTFCFDDAEERGCYATLDCDGPEDCPEGSVCCGEPSPSYRELGPSAARPLVTGCLPAAECTTPNVRLCNDAADCRPGADCCPERHGGIIGLCAPGCPGDG